MGSGIPIKSLHTGLYLEPTPLPVPLILLSRPLPGMATFFPPLLFVFLPREACHKGLLECGAQEQTPSVVLKRHR